MQWKHRTKSHVIKQIRERNLFNCIPESDTIQRVLNLLYPSIFANKNHAKYFLTVIGDNILKKNSHLIFLINQKTKKILNEIHHIACSSISNINVTHNFMCKYHENHSYENCRLLKINDCFSFELWEEQKEFDYALNGSSYARVIETILMDMRNFAQTSTDKKAIKAAGMWNDRILIAMAAEGVEI
jgi:hypothetical protein